MMYDRLIGAIIATLFGIFSILFCKRIGRALVLSENVFWKNIGVKTSSSEGYIAFAKYFVLFIGVVLFISGIIMFLQFFKGLK